MRGTLVTGLEEADIELLDIFEGNVRQVRIPVCTHIFSPTHQEYIRENISAYPLAAFVPLSSPESPSAVPLGTPPPLPPLDSLTAPIPAQTYVWSQPISRLSSNIWEYTDFMRDSAHKWVGADANSNADYIEVDRRRAMNGNTATTEITSVVVPTQ